MVLIWMWWGLTTKRPSLQKASSPSRVSGYLSSGADLEALAEPDRGPCHQGRLDPVAARRPNALEHADHQRVVRVEQRVGEIVAGRRPGQRQPSSGDGRAGAPIIGGIDLLGRVEAERAAHPPVFQERRGVPPLRVLLLEALEDRAMQDRLAGLRVGVGRVDDRRELLVVAGDQQALAVPAAPARSPPRGPATASLRPRRRDRPGSRPRPSGSTIRSPRTG